MTLILSSTSSSRQKTKLIHGIMFYECFLLNYQIAILAFFWVLLTLNDSMHKFSIFYSSKFSFVQLKNRSKLSECLVAMYLVCRIFFVLGVTFVEISDLPFFSRQQHSAKFLFTKYFFAEHFLIKAPQNTYSPSRLPMENHAGNSQNTRLLMISTYQPKLQTGETQPDLWPGLQVCGPCQPHRAH